MTRTIVGGFDTETTGLSQPDGHRLIEIALRLYDLESRELLGTYETRLNPERPIDPDATAVHGITFDDLIECPTWDVIGPKFSELLSKCRYLVAHNGVGFDAPFLTGEFLRIGAPVPPMFIVDTMLQGRWATPDGSVPNLQALCFACRVPYDREKAHAALYDVDVMMECFFRQYPRGFFELPVTPYQYVRPT